MTNDEWNSQVHSLLRDELERLRAAARNYDKPAATEVKGPAVQACKEQRVHSIRPAAIPPERPNTKPLFRLLAHKKEIFNSECPLRISSFIELLDNYPSPEFPALLADIIKYGAKIGYSGPSHVKIRRPNHPSAKVNVDTISEEISKELSLGRLRKLEKLPKQYYCSPLGLVPKVAEGVQTGWRRIFDLSSPAGNSVNDYIPSAYGTLKYETFDSAVQAIAKAGRGSILMKRDLKAAFRMIPVCTEDQWLLTFEWNGVYYQELFLPFGLCTAPFIFNLFGEAFEWILQHKYSWLLKRYLDDFLMIFPPDYDIATASEQFDGICTHLGFSEASEKRKDGTCVDYLGLILDTVKMEARLPKEKKRRAIQGITEILSFKTVTLKQLEKLLGLLEFCVSVFPLGRPFLRHVWNMFHKARSWRQRLTTAARQDLQWWKVFLPIWSGISAIQLSRNRLHIATDASGKKGIGGVWFEGKERNMFTTRLSRRHRLKHINWKELFAVLYAFASWSQQWSEARVIVLCDNDAVVAGINKRTIRGAAIRPLQTLFLLAAQRNIEVVAVWVPSKANALADALSRFDMKRVTNLVGLQQANSLPRRQPSMIMSKISQLMQPSTSTMALQSQPDQSTSQQ
jgi:Reverse transcriptase (RNA-dependent DNA polymerase)